MITIGVFDSGSGGLSIVNALEGAFPELSFLYFADTAYMPYGNLSKQCIESRTLYAMEWMHRKGVKLMIVGCHTSSSVLETLLHENFSYGEDTSYYGSMEVWTMMQPCLKSLLQQDSIMGVGILCTPLSKKQGSLMSYLQRRGITVPIHAISCGDLALYLEHQQISKAMSLLESLLTEVSAEIDTLLWGCTHYPQLYPLLPVALQHRFIDPSKAFIEQLRPRLSRLCHKGRRLLYCTGSYETIVKRVPLWKHVSDE